MAPTHREDVFDFADLKLLGVVCNRCDSEVVIDVSRDNPKVPVQCGACNESFDALFEGALDSFVSAYKNLSKSKGARARIRIKQPG